MSQELPRVVEQVRGGHVTVYRDDGTKEHYASLAYAAKCLGVTWDTLADHMERTNGVRPTYTYGGYR